MQKLQFIALLKEYFLLFSSFKMKTSESYNLFNSIFSTQGEEQINFVKEPFSPDWLIAFFMLQIVFISWLRLYHPNRLNLLVNSYFNNRFIDQLTREEKSSGIYNWAVEFLYFLGFTTLLYLSNHQFKIFDLGLHGGFEFTMIALSFLLFVLVKSLLMRLLAWLFDMEIRFGDIHFYRFLNHSILSFAIFPLLLMSVFIEWGTEYWLSIAWIIVGTSYLYRLLRSVIRFWSYNTFSFKYIILYICALEILPLGFLVKASFNSLKDSGI